MTTKKKPAKKAPTHRIEFTQEVNDATWNWHVVRVENGEIICSSNQGHENIIDARQTVERLIAAVKLGRVQVVK